jgi:hypothetical protein
MTRLLIVIALFASFVLISPQSTSAAGTCATIRLHHSYNPIASMFGCTAVSADHWVKASGYCNRQARKLSLQYDWVGDVFVQNYYQNGCLFDSTTMSYVRQ